MVWTCASGGIVWAWAAGVSFGTDTSPAEAAAMAEAVGELGSCPAGTGVGFDDGCDGALPAAGSARAWAGTLAP